jgi:hypothetical protein
MSEKCNRKKTVRIEEDGKPSGQCNQYKAKQPGLVMSCDNCAYEHTFKPKRPYKPIGSKETI